MNTASSHLQSTAAVPAQNRLLAALSPEVQRRLFPHLESVVLPFGKVLYEPGGTINYVYFPTNSIVSLLYVTEDGASMGFSVVGHEGVVGIAALLGSDSMPSQATVLSSGFACRMKVHLLKNELSRHGELLALILRYTQTLMTQMAQTAVCNRHHSIEQQLCRWLLLSLDRLASNKLAMTQELIANMLGVRREGVTEAAGKLKQLGVIEYSRGHITVIDRARLERLSCECYAVIKAETDRLAPHPLRQPSLETEAFTNGSSVSESSCRLLERGTRSQRRHL